MSTTPETRIWSGRVGGDSTLERNRHYRLDTGLGAVLRHIWFKCFPVRREPLPRVVFAVGSAGSNGVEFESSVNDLVSWSARQVPGARFRKVVFLPSASRLVAVGEDGVWTSDDFGVTWVSRLIYDMWAVAFSPTLGTIGRLVVGGNNEAFAYSDDLGDTWIGPGTPPSSSIMRDIAWSPSLSRFVYVSHRFADAIYYSNTGTSWTSAGVNAGANVLAGVCWNPVLGRFVVVGFQGVCYTSATGVAASWSLGPTVPIPAGFSARGVAVDGTGIMTAVGSNRVCMSDLPFTAWTVKLSPVAELWAVIYLTSVSRWVAVGTGSAIYVSTDASGSVWVPVSGAPPGGDLLGLAEVLGVGDYWREYPIPRVNVVHVSCGRPAASQRFPVGFFSLGVSQNVGVGLMAQESPLALGIPLTLDWDLAPGDVVEVQTDLNEPAVVEFVAELLQAPGEEA